MNNVIIYGCAFSAIVFSVMSLIINITTVKRQSRQLKIAHDALQNPKPHRQIKAVFWDYDGQNLMEREVSVGLNDVNIPVNEKCDCDNGIRHLDDREEGQTWSEEICDRCEGSGWTYGQRVFKAHHVVYHEVGKPAEEEQPKVVYIGDLDNI